MTPNHREKINIRNEFTDTKSLSWGSSIQFYYIYIHITHSFVTIWKIYVNMHAEYKKKHIVEIKLIATFYTLRKVADRSKSLVFSLFRCFLLSFGNVSKNLTTNVTFRTQFIGKSAVVLCCWWVALLHIFQIDSALWYEWMWIATILFHRWRLWLFIQCFSI